MIACATAIVAHAQPVSMRQALQKAQQFMPAKQFVSEHPRKAFGTPDSVAVMPYYIFNAVGEDGFVVVAGDERMGDVLGFSERGCMNADSLPANVCWWLSAYSEAFEALQTKDCVRNAPEHVERETVEPLLKTHWDQRAPYNNLCPFVGSQRCLTGCVATAVAQLMKYYEHPVTSKATFQYRTNTNKLTMKALPATDFDWDSMQDTYAATASRTAQDAVATLMLYCGCALSMDYDVDGSGADVTPVCDAMEYFFGYDETIQKVYREDYTDAEWEVLLYEQLAKGCPVFYSGNTTGNEGHAFVCDGYDRGFFHINWGWGGFCDGHFKLSVLYPYADSYDETEHEGGYAFSQMAVVNVVPKGFQGFETGIQSLGARSAMGDRSANGTFYNMAGQRLTVPQKGLNVAGDRKVWVK